MRKFLFQKACSAFLFLLVFFLDFSFFSLSFINLRSALSWLLKPIVLGVKVPSSQLHLRSPKVRSSLALAGSGGACSAQAAANGIFLLKKTEIQGTMQPRIRALTSKMKRKGTVHFIHSCIVPIGRVELVFEHLCFVKHNKKTC